MTGSGRVADGSPVFLLVMALIVIGLALLGALLGWMGLPGALVVGVLVVAALAPVALRGLKGAVAAEADFEREDIALPPQSAGLAAGIEWLSAFGIFGIAGAVFAFGHDGLAVLIGLAVGFVVSLALIAPRLNRAAGRSVSAYLETRFGGAAMRWSALGALGAVTVLIVIVQMLAWGLVAEHGLDLPRWLGAVAGAAVLLLMTLPGGARTLPAVQAPLAALSGFAILLAAGWLTASATGIAVPHFAWGGFLADIAAAETRLALDPQFGTPFAMLGADNFLLLILSFAAGSAAMPALIARVSGGGPPRAARSALVRGIAVFLLVAAALPALGVLARIEVLQLFTTARGELGFDALADGGALARAAAVCGAAVSEAQAACAALGYEQGFPAEALTLAPQDIALLAPALSGAASWLIGLLALGALAAALTAGGGAALTFAQALTDRSASVDAVSAGRTILCAVVLLSTAIAIGTGVDILSLGAWAFSLAAAAFFAPLIGGLWWPRTSRAGALAGLIGGFGVTALYILGSSWGLDLRAETGDEWVWLGVPPLAAGAVGLLISGFLTFAVSIAGEPPDPAERARIDEVNTRSERMAQVTEGPEAPE